MWKLYLSAWEKCFYNIFKSYNFQRKSVEKVLLAEIKKREELSEETAENFLSLNEDLKKDISKIDNQLEIAFFQLKNNKKDVSKEVKF